MPNTNDDMKAFYAQVRNCALHTLCSTAATHGAFFITTKRWGVCMQDTMLPLLDEVETAARVAGDVEKQGTELG